MRDFLDRYGPTAGMILAVVLLVLFLPANTHSGAGPASSTSNVASGPAVGPAAADNGAAATATASGAAAATGASGANAASSPGAVAAANTASANGAQAARAQAGSYPCRSDGRQAGISGYTPPCHQFDGNNGGATARGVTATAIKIAYYVPQANAATQAALKAAGAGDSQADIDRVMEVLRRYYNDHYQTYGREVQFTKIDASGAAQDDVAAKADAHKIADAGYFGVLIAGLSSGSPTFDSTVAQLGVECVYCSATQANSFYQRTSPYIWGALPSAREYYQVFGEYWGKRLAGKNASFAGPEAEGQPATPSPTELRNQKRKFGLIWLNANMGTVDPGAQEERDYFVNTILPKWGITNIVDASYNYDLTQAPSTAQTIISKMNTSGVTTIAMFAEPLTPVFFTREATKEAYYPEWFQTGTGLTDTTFFGRTYDSGQWQHSFGVSPLWVFWQNLQVSEGYREYHHACDQAGVDCSPGAESVGINTYRGGVIALYTGIEMAGADLNPQTFAQGMYSYPATGGTPAAPLFHFTKESPNILKDFTEVWWNPAATGKDEANNNGAGILQKAQNGKRYLAGQWPAADPYAFGNDPNPVYTSDEPYLHSGIPLHEADGHHHPPAEKCLSCGGPWPN